MTKLWMFRVKTCLVAKSYFWNLASSGIRVQAHIMQTFWKSV